MNALLPTLVVLAVVNSGCENSAAPFSQGAEFSKTEKQSLVALGLDHANWQPDCTAVWRDARSERRVSLFHNDIASVVEHVQVLVLDQAGHFVEANVVEVSRIGGVRYPKALLGVDPVRIEFERNGRGDSETAVAVYSASEGLRQLQEWCRRGREARARGVGEGSRAK